MGWIMALVLLLGCAGGAYYFLRSGPPAKWKLDGRALIVTDRAGAFLWRQDFPQPWQQGFYPPALESRRFWFGDLDGDGAVETLALYRPEKPENGGSALYCLSAKGAVKWSYRPGHTTQDAVNRYSAVFAPADFRVIPGQVDRQPLIVVTSHHVSEYPNQVATLDTAGRTIAEYWHSGPLTEMTTGDLDHDGKDELLLAGVNAARQQTTLILLDPEKMSGASVEPEGNPRQLRGFTPGTEKAVVLLPLSEPAGVSVIGEEVRLDVRMKGVNVRYVFDKRLNLSFVEGNVPDKEEVRRAVTVIRK